MLFHFILHEISIRESDLFGYEDHEYCNETPELRRDDGRNCGAILSGRRHLRLTFVPPRWADGNSLTNDTVGRLLLSTWVKRSYTLGYTIADTAPILRGDFPVLEIMQHIRHAACLSIVLFDPPSSSLLNHFNVVN